MGVGRIGGGGVGVWGSKWRRVWLGGGKGGKESRGRGGRVVRLQERWGGESGRGEVEMGGVEWGGKGAKGGGVVEVRGWEGVWLVGGGGGKGGEGGMGRERGRQRGGGGEGVEVCEGNNG